jgi:hypothetical protein
MHFTVPVQSCTWYYVEVTWKVMLSLTYITDESLSLMVSYSVLSRYTWVIIWFTHDPKIITSFRMFVSL